MVARDARAAATRERIVATAERLFAEHGVEAVSNRQIGEAAGQGNNTVVSYHFGSKDQLVRAIVRRHTEPMERLRDRLVAAAGASARVRDWVACMVFPYTEHLAELGAPTWFGRFGAQVMTHPVYRDIMAAESLESPSLVRTADRLNACVPDLPPGVRVERHEMARQLIVHMVAERERTLAAGGGSPREVWPRTAAGLVDVITAAWSAPVTRPDAARA